MASLGAGAAARARCLLRAREVCEVAKGRSRGVAAGQSRSLCSSRVPSLLGAQEACEVADFRNAASPLSRASASRAIGAAGQFRSLCSSRVPTLLGAHGNLLQLRGLFHTSRLAFAAFSKPQELHRHRKRLEGFGKDAPKGDTKTLAACHDLLRDEDWFARKTAVDVIGRVANPQDDVQIAVLYKRLEDDDIFVREASVDAVAEIARRGDDVAVSKLAMRLADEDCFVRTRAVVALGRIGLAGDTDTFGLLEEMFEDGFVPVRRKAVDAAVQLAAPTSEGQTALVQRLRKCLADSDRNVREDAKGALAKIEER